MRESKTSLNTATNERARSISVILQYKFQANELAKWSKKQIERVHFYMWYMKD